MKSDSYHYYCKSIGSQIIRWETLGITVVVFSSRTPIRIDNNIVYSVFTFPQV
jgi:hypothetical protein